MFSRCGHSLACFAAGAIPSWLTHTHYLPNPTPPLLPTSLPPLQHEASSAALAKGRHIRQLGKDCGHVETQPYLLPFSQVHHYIVLVAKRLKFHFLSATYYH